MEIKTKATRYSRAFKEGVCKEYLLGLFSKRGLEEKYKLGNGRVRGWLIELNLFKQEITTLEVVNLPSQIPSRR